MDHDDEAEPRSAGGPAEHGHSDPAKAQVLQAAMRSHAVVEQAKGILSIQLQVRPEDASAYLSKLSQDTSTTLPDLAVDIVRRAADGRPS